MAIPASTRRPLVRTADVTLTLDTSTAYAAGDVLAATQEVPNFLEGGAPQAFCIVNITVIDRDDLGSAFDLLFFGENVSIGTENLACTLTDDNASKLLFVKQVYDFSAMDFGGCKLTTLDTGLYNQWPAPDGATSIWIAAVARAAQTRSATGLRLRISYTQI